jgi:hypothetical protein
LYFLGRLRRGVSYLFSAFGALFAPTAQCLGAACGGKFYKSFQILQIFFDKKILQIFFTSI